MKFINTDGMAFIGPGSEWFWTAISGIVLAVTFLGIFRQLRIARSANAFEQMNRILNDWDSERLTRNRLEILLALKDGAMPDQLPDGAATSIIDFWDDTASLVRAGHVDRALMYDTLRASCRQWWAMLAPYLRRIRVETGVMGGGDHFEWLAGVMADMERKAGATSQYADEERLASTLDRRIWQARSEIRIAEELRAVIVRPLSPPLMDTMSSETPEPLAT